MKNNLDNEPSLDYFELRRRHEEYKNSLRRASEQPQADADAPAAKPAADAAEPVTAEPVVTADAPEEPVAGPQDIPEDIEEESDADYAADEPDEEYPDDADDADDEAPVDENPNPFDSFIKAFHGLRSRFGKRRAAEEDDDDEEYEDDADDGEAGEAGESDETAVPQASWPRVAPAEESDAGEAADVEDLPAYEAPVRPQDGEAPDDIGDMDYPDDDEDDEDEDEDEGRKPGEVGGFKKFLRLFVVPVDEDERISRPDGEDDDEDDLEDDIWSGEGDGEWSDGAGEEIEAERQSQTAAAVDIEGGLDMSDQNNVTAEVASQLAADLEQPGLSRRERRELAMRQAAEKAKNRSRPMPCRT